MAQGPSDESPYSWDIPQGAVIDTYYIDLALNINHSVHYVVFVVGGISCFLLFYLVMWKTKKHLRQYRVMFIVSSVAEIQYWMVTFLCQLVANIKDGVVLVVLQGPLHPLPYNLKAVMIGVYGMHVSLIVYILPASCYYRYICVKTSKEPTTSQMVKIYVLVYLASTMVVFSSLAYVYSGLERPGYNYGKLYFPITPMPIILPGDLSSIYTKLTFAFVATSFVISYCLALLFSQRTLSHVRVYKPNFSKKTRELDQQLSKTLLLQAIIPLFTSVGPSMMILTSLVFSLDLGIANTFMLTSLSTIPIFGPLSTIFIIRPFRSALVKTIGPHHPLPHLSPSNILFYILQDYRTQLYYVFGVTCLLSWLAFNLYILRDYFFPCWFDTVYTEDGLNKEELEQAKMNYMVRQKVSSAMAIPTSVGVPSDVKKNMMNKGRQRSYSLFSLQGVIVRS